MTTKTYTQERITKVLNKTADEILDALGDPEEGIPDAIGLLINVVGHRLFKNPRASLRTAVEANYPHTVEAVREDVAEGSLDPGTHALDQILDWCGR